MIVGFGLVRRRRPADAEQRRCRKSLHDVPQAHQAPETELSGATHSSTTGFVKYNIPVKRNVAGKVTSCLLYTSRRMAQRQRGWREDRGRRAGIALAGKDVENDIGGMDAVGDRFRTSRLDRWQPIGEHCGDCLLYTSRCV